MTYLKKKKFSALFCEKLALLYTPKLCGFVWVGRGGGGRDFSSKCHALCPICLTFLGVHFRTHIYDCYINLCGLPLKVRMDPLSEMRSARRWSGTAEQRVDSKQTADRTGLVCKLESWLKRESLTRFKIFLLAWSGENQVFASSHKNYYCITVQIDNCTGYLSAYYTRPVIYNQTDACFPG